MSSAVEQLAKGANWKAFTQATELKQRIMFVLGALLIYRLGTYIPVPGIEHYALYFGLYYYATCSGDVP